MGFAFVSCGLQTSKIKIAYGSAWLGRSGVRANGEEEKGCPGLPIGCMRDRARGETNDELRDRRATRSKMSKIETKPSFAVVEGNKGNDKVFGKRFVNTTRNDSEDAIIYNFLSGAIEVHPYRSK